MSRNGALDNLRILLITLVIAHHAGQAYGPTGGDWPIHNAEQARWLGPFFGVNAAFFMGLFFWIAGYFTPGAFDRKGLRGFLGDRLLRIGVPLGVYMLLASVPIAYKFHPETSEGLSLIEYWLRPWRWHWPSLYGHLWFLGHLLVYAFAYAAWRAWRGSARSPLSPAAGNPRNLWWIVAGPTVVSALVRSVFPQDRWVFVGIPAEVMHLPQYVTLFALGIVAARIGWLEQVPSRVGRIWLLAGLVAAALAYITVLMVPPGLPRAIPDPGLSWNTWKLALWEAVVCVGLSVGLIVLFRDRLAAASRLTRELSASSYAVYIVHILIVVSFQLTVAESDLPPTLKFLYVTAAAWVCSFAVASVLRRLPGTRRVL